MNSKITFLISLRASVSKVVLQTVTVADNLRERSRYVFFCFFFMFMNIKANALFSNYS